jgi:acyl carrier protein
MHIKKPGIEEIIMVIVAKQMPVSKERITLETTFTNDLAADSLDLAELQMELEVAFDLEISNEDAENLLTIGETVDYIKKQVQR